MDLTHQDRSHIRDLVEQYALPVDSRDFTGASELFTPDALLIVPEPPDRLDPVRTVAGRAAIQQELAGLKFFAVTFHSVCGQSVRLALEADRAEGRVNCVAHHISQSAEGARGLTRYLRYDDSYQRTESGWLLARRALTIEVIDSRPVKRVNDVLPHLHSRLGAS